MYIDFLTLHILFSFVQVLIPIANGSQGIELVTIADILRRAKVDVVIASVEKSLQILASTGTKVVADKLIKEAAESIYDIIILPVSLLKFLKNFDLITHFQTGRKIVRVFVSGLENKFIYSLLFTRCGMFTEALYLSAIL